MDSLRELFRYEKAGRIRIYSLREQSDGSELWMTSVTAGRAGDAKKKMAFANPDDEGVCIEDVERTLRAGGWRRMAR